MSSLRWYAQRLRAMPPGEVPWRAFQMLRHRWGARRRWPRVEDVPLNDVWCGDGSATEVRGGGPMWPLVPELETTPGWPQRWRDDCVAEAEDVLAHRFSFFALNRQSLGERIDWNRDYSTGKTIPLEYAFSIDYRNADVVGDVKYVWELGRMQHLPRLAQAWRLTGDERFAQEVVNQIGEWISQCPHMMGVHWISPMEAGLRLISWTWAFQLLRDWNQLGDESYQTTIRSIHQQLDFIDRNYSRYSSANNHLIAEASGAYFASAYWCGLKKADRWRHRAKSHLVRECERQIYHDGVGKEQTFGYLFFVWDLLVLAGWMGRETGDEFPSDYWSRLKATADFLTWVSDCNGNTPNVGDEDGGRAVILAKRSGTPALSLISTAVRIWQRPELRALAGDAEDEQTSWLLGPRQQSVAAGLDLSPGSRNVADVRRGGRVFPDGGYVVLREGTAPEDEVLVLFDIGNIGWPATAVHGHADALAIVLHLGGQPVLIDPGTFSYQDTPWRRYFRSTAQHNTLCFGEQDQSEYLNRFMWGKRSTTRLLQAEFKSGHHIAEAEVRWWTGEWHKRRLQFLPERGQIRIEDAWSGKTIPSIRFCLSPEVKTRGKDGAALVQAGEFRLHVVNDVAVAESEVFEVSPSCYHRQTASRIIFKMSVATGRAVTTISWEKTSLA